MAVIENRFVCDLSKPVQAQALKGNVFSLDNLGSRISVLIYDNGQPSTISGSVTANCILPDGSTVNVNGGLTTENGGSKAYVDVPQSCLLIPGILKIAIKCTSSSVITTLAAIVANVYMTKTDNVITPSQQIINDWNAEISAAIATQNAAIANQDTKINDLKNTLTNANNAIINGDNINATRLRSGSYNNSTGEYDSTAVTGLCCSEVMQQCKGFWALTLVSNRPLNGLGIFFYDKTKQFVSASFPTGAFRGNYYYCDVPSNAVYFNFNIYANGASDIALTDIKIFGTVFNAYETDPVATRFYGKKISVVGDSISTFNKDGYKIDGYNMFYPGSSTVKSENQTWWKRVINASRAILEANTSYGGARVTNTGASGVPDFYDMCSLVGNPDIIFVGLGTNDSAGNVALGTADFTTEYTSLSESTFLPAYIKGIKALQASCPNAKIICLSFKMGWKYASAIKFVADRLGCEYIDVRGYTGTDNETHPDYEGMKKIAANVLYPFKQLSTELAIVDDSAEYEMMPKRTILDETGEISEELNSGCVCSKKRYSCTPGETIHLLTHKGGAFSGLGIMYYNAIGEYIGYQAQTNKTWNHFVVPQNAHTFSVNAYFGDSRVASGNYEISIWHSGNTSDIIIDPKEITNENLLYYSNDLSNADYWGDFSTFDDVVEDVTDEKGGSEGIKLILEASETSKTGYFGMKTQKKQTKIAKIENTGRYVFSVFVKANRAITITGRALVNGSGTVTSQTFEIPANGSFERIFIIVEYLNGSAISYPDIYFMIPNDSQSDTEVTFAHPKLERGFQPTVYTNGLPPVSDLMPWLVFPSDNPAGNQREYLKIRVPESVNKFVDNVLSIQNDSHGPWGGAENDSYGNACITFMDSQAKERGAVGYSRNSLIQPNGFVADTMYIEIGDAFNTGHYTDFRVICTIPGQNPRYFYPIEALAQSGNLNLSARFNGHVNVYGGLVPDALYLKSANNKLWQITVGNDGTLSTTEVT